MTEKEYKEKDDVLKNLLPKIWYKKGYGAWIKSLKTIKPKNKAFCH